MNPKNRTPASRIALGGMMAALAVVIMSLGGLIPVATYVSPMLCTILLQFVYLSCGKRIGWAWYGAVAILSVLLSPDKEAAGVFVFLGYYPMVKPLLDRKKLGLLWKALLFNASMGILYFLLLKVFGLSGVSEDFEEVGRWMLAVLLVMGNAAFFLLDYLLGMKKYRRTF